MAFSKIWWHVNENGQRIGYMDPIEFESILAGYYGDKTWVRLFALDFGFSQPTVYRWAQGLTPLPRHVSMIVVMLAKLGGPSNLPAMDTPWLPEVDENTSVPGQPKALKKARRVKGAEPVSTPKHRPKTFDPSDFIAVDRSAVTA